MAHQIAVSIIEKNHILREGYRRVLSRTPLQVADVYSDIEECVEKQGAEAHPSDVILISIGRVGVPSEEDIQRLRAANRKAYLVIGTDSADHPALSGPLATMVDGALLQSAQPDAMIKSIELIMMGERFFPAPPRIFHDAEDDEHEHGARFGHALGGPKVLASLSPREKDVLSALIHGASNKLIARELEISDATVKVHVKSILRKIGAHNRTEAALWAVGLGFVGEDPGSAPSDRGPHRANGSGG